MWIFMNIFSPETNNSRILKNWFGQIIATSQDFHPKKRSQIGREMGNPAISGDFSGWWSIIIWPDWCLQKGRGVLGCGICCSVLDEWPIGSMGLVYLGTDLFTIKNQPFMPGTPNNHFINGCFNRMIPNLYIGNGCQFHQTSIYKWLEMGFEV